MFGDNHGAKFSNSGKYNKTDHNGYLQTSKRTIKAQKASMESISTPVPQQEIPQIQNSNQPETQMMTTESDNCQSQSLSPIQKVAKLDESSTCVTVGKRKRLNDQMTQIQKIMNKMISVDKIVNEFYELGM